MTAIVVELPDRDEEWKEYVRTLACCVCDIRRQVEAHHIRDVGFGGMALRPPDWVIAPLCLRCHRRQEHARLTAEEMKQLYKTALQLVVQYLVREKSAKQFYPDEERF